MKFNPITNELFTDSGTFLKKLHCPLNMQWNSLHQAIPFKGKLCNNCDKVIFDSGLIKDEQLQRLIKVDPNTCLKIDLNQPNLTITHERYTKQR